MGVGAEPRGGRSFRSLGGRAGGEDGGPDRLGARDDSRGCGGGRRWPELSGGWGWGTEVACRVLSGWGQRRVAWISKWASRRVVKCKPSVAHGPCRHQTHSPAANLSGRSIGMTVAVFTKETDDLSPRRGHQGDQGDHCGHKAPASQRDSRALSEALLTGPRLDVC